MSNLRNAMFILGLTGSLGMGKSTTAKFFADEGVPVHDADAAVHRLYEGEAVPLIEAAFPGTTEGGKVDRDKLGKRVLGDADAIKKLESIVHPLVAAARDRFLAEAEKRGAKIAVLDIPLLYETGGERLCDAVVVVSAPAEMQRQRAFERPGMTRRETRRHPRQADAGCGKARPRRFRGGYVARASRPRTSRCVKFSRRSLQWRITRNKMREIVLDTETTGLDPNQGHRLVELGCVELINRIPTGATFHAYLDPERDMPAEAFAIHGLSTEFLKGQKRFVEVVDDFLAFIADAPLVIHNAGFDHAFLCAELKRIERELIARDRLVDTLMLARRKHSAGPYNLDALCARYGIDNSRRTKHGALLDAEILAEVYLELIGGRQAQLGLAEKGGRRANGGDRAGAVRARPVALAPRISEAERAAHREFVQSLGESALWRGYRS